MDQISITGYIAGILTTIAFIPQVLRAWELKETRDISLAMLVLLAIGIALWAVYGSWIGSLPVVFANVVTLLLVLALLAMKMKYH
jgi:MtN3 and saliva related transmembrane protein